MEGLCRGCLLQFSAPADLLQYTEKNRRLFVYSTGLQVKRNDAFTFQLCKECYMNMKQSCKFKKQCRTSEKKFKNYLVFKQKDGGGDFGHYIKSIDEHFRLPFSSASGYSTPAHQTVKDDDSESTCTSIRNFMTDILDGEDMPPTEARIIREVIEEEADVLDDSLDSYWLQDDVSVASDFDGDFGISPFGTPRSVQNVYYTPKRIDEAKQRQINYLTSKEIVEKINKSQISQKYDMPSLDNMDLDIVENIPENRIETDFQEDIDIKSNHELDNSIPSEVEDMVTENSILSTLQCFNTDLPKDLVVRKQMDILESDITQFETIVTTEAQVEKSVANSTSTDDICIIISQGDATKKDVPVTNELEYYINKAEHKKRITSLKDKKEYHCTIDRNIDIALKHAEKKEYPLDHLIVSPAVSLRSGVSTPTIQNILFGYIDTKTETPPDTSTPITSMLGEKLDTDTAPRYFPQVGQNIEDFDDDDDDKNEIKTEMQHNEYATDRECDIGGLDSIDLKLGDKELDHNEQVTDKTQSEHIEVLNEFLKDASDRSVDLYDGIMDPEEFRKELLDKDIFKRPLTPPIDQYDLEKSLCKICNRTFAGAKWLKQHFAKKHSYVFPKTDKHRNKSQKTLIKMCGVCGIMVKGAPNYRRHMETHRDKTNVFFECNECGMFFKSKTALQTHMRIHNNMTPVKQKQVHICHICGRNSKTTSHHKLHMRRHFKQVSDTCHICQKGFYRNNELQTHIRIAHEGERPYQCQYCPKNFKRRLLLHAHLKRHLGKLDYKCETCNLEFVTQNILALHYGSKKCIQKRLLQSQLLPGAQVTVQYRTGSLKKVLTKTGLCTDTNKQEIGNEIKDRQFSGAKNDKEVKDQSPNANDDGI